MIRLYCLMIMYLWQAVSQSVVGPILMEHYYMEGFQLLDHAIIHSTG